MAGCGFLATFISPGFRTATAAFAVVKILDYSVRYKSTWLTLHRSGRGRHAGIASSATNNLIPVSFPKLGFESVAPFLPKTRNDRISSVLWRAFSSAVKLHAQSAHLVRGLTKSALFHIKGCSSKTGDSKMVDIMNMPFTVSCVHVSHRQLFALFSATLSLRLSKKLVCVCFTRQLPRQGRHDSLCSSPKAVAFLVALPYALHILNHDAFRVRHPALHRGTALEMVYQPMPDQERLLGESQAHRSHLYLYITLLTLKSKFVKLSRMKGESGVRCAERSFPLRSRCVVSRERSDSNGRGPDWTHRGACYTLPLLRLAWRRPTAEGSHGGCSRRSRTLGRDSEEGRGARAST